MIFRQEKPGDQDAIWNVNTSAFKTDAEAKLVNALNKSENDCLSLVAEHENKIIGHIFFSPINIKGDEENPEQAIALGPMAVSPEHQGKGVGGKLLQAGLEACVKADYELCLVLGHTWFYPKFGFKPSKPYGIKCAYDVSPEHFMLIELQDGAADRYEGTAHYLPEFDEV